MSRRAAIITEADVTRAVKAARKGGAGAVEIKPDGTILILMQPPALVRAVTPTTVADDDILVL